METTTASKGYNNGDDDDDDVVPTSFFNRAIMPVVDGAKNSAKRTGKL